MSKIMIKNLCELVGYEVKDILTDGRTFLVELNNSFNNSLLIEGLSFQDTCNQIENLI